MKTTHRLILLAALAASATPAFPQGGPLTPPAGAPVPTMKSLDQVEPRRPLVAGVPGVAIGAAGTITISQSGSYYLTANLQITGNANGIEINANGVTLDLMGYSIIAPAAGNAQIGIRIGGSSIAIRNGHIVSGTTFNGSSFVPAGFQDGVSALSDAYVNVRISDLVVAGVREDGIDVPGEACSVENCSVHIAGSAGIHTPLGPALGCVVRTTGSNGIYAAVVANCSATGALGTGLSAWTVTNSQGSSSSGGAQDGISARTVENSCGTSLSGHGINAMAAVHNSYGESIASASGRNGISCPDGQVSGSRGWAAGGHGISARSVANSVGESSGADGSSSSGISADRVSVSWGKATSTSGGRGIAGMYSVTASYGSSSADAGIAAFEGSVTDSHGTSTGNVMNASYGIVAHIVANSGGKSTHAGGAAGISATLTLNSYGTSAGSHGIAATAVNNCCGETSSTWSTSCGISSATVTGSYGTSSGTGGGDGICASIVTSSVGYAVEGAEHGISATIVESSFGSRWGFVEGKFGIRADRASLSYSFPNESITFKYNMP